MRQFFTLVFLLLTGVISHAQSVKWLSSDGGANGNPEFRDLASDSKGNIYAIGSFNNATITVNGTPIATRGGYDAFLVKYNSNGVFQWIKTIAGTGTDIGLQVETDVQGKVYVSVVALSNPLQVADSTLNTSVSGLLRFDSTGKFEAVLRTGMTLHDLKIYEDAIYARSSTHVLMKLKLDGSTVWSKSISGSLRTNNLVPGFWPETSLDITPHGNLIFSQSCAGNSSYGFDGVSIAGGGTSSHQFLVASLADTNGVLKKNYTWGMGQSALMYSRRAVVDSNHNVYLAANFEQSYVQPFGSSVLQMLTGGTSYNVVLKFDSAAVPQWGFNVTCANNGAFFYDMGLDKSGNIAMVGMYSTVKQLGGFTLPNNGSIFTATINPAGTLLTATGFGSNGSGRCMDLQLLKDGSFALGGLSRNAPPITFGCFTSVNSGFMLMKYSYDPPPVPEVSFSFLREQRKVYFTSDIKNAMGFQWDFGDGTTSTQRNPTHVYKTPGNFTTKLIGSNTCGNDTAAVQLLYKGIQKLVPNKIANNRFQIVMAKGGFPFDTARLILKQGARVLTAESVTVTDSGFVQGNFLFRNEPLGLYDVIIQSGSFADTLKNGLELEKEKDPGLTIQVDGPQLRLVNRLQRYRVTVSNPGNINHFGVPVIIAMHPDQEVGKISNRILTDSIGHVVRDSAFKNDFIKIKDPRTNDSILIGYFVIPVVAAQSSESIEFYMKGKTLGGKPLYAILLSPMYDSLQLVQLGLQRTQSSCDFYADPVVCILDLVDQVPGAGCITSVLSLGCAIGNLGRDAVGNRNKSGDVSKYMADVFNLLSDMAGVLTCEAGPLGKGPKEYAKNLAEDLLVDVMDKVFGVSGALANGDVPDIPFSALGLPIDLPGACVQSFTEREKRKDISDWFIKDVSSMDPNDKTGPAGFTTENFIDGNGLMHYTIRFENINTATAPASEVRIYDTLDAGFYDVSSIRFTGFGFADSSYQILFAPGSYVQEIDLRPAKNTIVRFKAFLDTANNVLKWTFESLDPVTRELVVGVNDGFLNPNVTSPEGEGFVSFSIMPLPNRPHLQQVQNRAEIIFDENASIFTNYWVNTIDKVGPSSQVLPLPAVINDTLFTVKWQGADNHSGIKNYDVFVIVNDTLTYKLLSNTRADSIRVKGQMGSTYKFYSVAIDQVGNLEQPPSDPKNNPDAIIRLQVATNVPDWEINNGIKVYPTVTNGVVHINSRKNIWVDVFSLTGQPLLRNRVNGTGIVDLSGFPPGVYFIRTSPGNKLVKVVRQ